MLIKIELSEIAPFFYNNFFGIGGGVSPFPPGYALVRTGEREGTETSSAPKSSGQFKNIVTP